MEPNEIFEKAWDILVEHGGASTDPEEKRRFVTIMTTRDQHGGFCTEFRFCGHFGFGGKFRRSYSHDGLHVNYYPEDHTPELDALEAKINTLLKELPYWEPPR